MENTERITNYLELLKIRRAAGKRDALLTGALFLVLLLATLGIGLVSGLSGREVYLIVALDLASGAGFLTAWTRLEILRHNIALLEQLLEG